MKIYEEWQILHVANVTFHPPAPWTMRIASLAAGPVPRSGGLEGQLP